MMGQAIGSTLGMGASLLTIGMRGQQIKRQRDRDDNRRRLLEKEQDEFEQTQAQRYWNTYGRQVNALEQLATNQQMALARSGGTAGSQAAAQTQALAMAPSNAAQAHAAANQTALGYTNAMGNTYLGGRQYGLQNRELTGNQERDLLTRSSQNLDRFAGAIGGGMSAMGSSAGGGGGGGGGGMGAVGGMMGGGGGSGGGGGGGMLSDERSKMPIAPRDGIYPQLLGAESGGSVQTMDQAYSQLEAPGYGRQVSYVPPTSEPSVGGGFAAGPAPTSYDARPVSRATGGDPNNPHDVRTEQNQAVTAAPVESLGRGSTAGTSAAPEAMPTGKSTYGGAADYTGQVKEGPYVAPQNKMLQETPIRMDPTTGQGGDETNTTLGQEAQVRQAAMATDTGGQERVQGQRGYLTDPAREALRGFKPEVISNADRKAMARDQGLYSRKLSSTGGFQRGLGAPTPWDAPDPRGAGYRGSRFSGRARGDGKIEKGPSAETSATLDRASEAGVLGRMREIRGEREREDKALMEWLRSKEGRKALKSDGSGDLRAASRGKSGAEYARQLATFLDRKFPSEAFEGPDVPVRTGETVRLQPQGQVVAPPPVGPSGMRYDDNFVRSDKRSKRRSGKRDASDVFEHTPGYMFRYRPEYEGGPGAEAGMHMGVMAQDLEKTPEGSTVVRSDRRGLKRVDTDRLAMLNSAGLHDILKRLDRLEERRRG